jgi:excisionase family DNA binding protein
MTIELVSKDDLSDLEHRVLSQMKALLEQNIICPALKEWLTIEEACEYLQVSKSTIQNYRRKGILGFSQIGSKIYFKRAELVAHIERHYVAASK